MASKFRLAIKEINLSKIIEILKMQSYYEPTVIYPTEQSSISIDNTKNHSIREGFSLLWCGWKILVPAVLKRAVIGSGRM
jgi:hypothetical protein